MQFTTDVTADTISLIEARAHDGRDAGRIIDALLMGVFTALKHDKEFILTHDRFDLLVADVARDAEQTLFAAIDGHVSLQDACDAVISYFPAGEGLGEE
jgi:hypothetical protein